MSASEITAGNRPAREVCAEAAAWLTNLQDPDRTADVEKGFRLWLAERPDHAVAFEMATETWERAARLYRRPAERVARWERPGFHISFTRATMAMAAVAALAVLGTALYFRSGAVTTDIGEQRTLTLQDGTRVFLNTGTRVVVDYDKHQRHLHLESGEALFEVARDTPNRPFVVTAADRRITALATSFVVRRDEQRLSVTLVDGRVAVAPTAVAQADPDHEASDSRERPLILTPGQRLTFTGQRPPSLDTPVLDKVTAWQRGQVAFDNTPLSDAIEELNRYSAVKLAIEQPQTARVRVSGVFRAGDNLSFARAMAETYRLQHVESSNRIMLAGVAVMPRE